jgi:hypothetical protein
MEWIGTVRPRAAGEIASSNWRLGCEVLDRDFADFGEYRDFDDEKSGFVTGITVPVDGGFLASAGV